MNWMNDWLQKCNILFFWMKIETIEILIKQLKQRKTIVGEKNEAHGIPRWWCCDWRLSRWRRCLATTSANWGCTLVLDDSWMCPIFAIYHQFHNLQRIGRPGWNLSIPCSPSFIHTLLFTVYFSLFFSSPDHRFLSLQVLLTLERNADRKLGFLIVKIKIVFKLTNLLIIFACTGCFHYAVVYKHVQIPNPTFFFHTRICQKFSVLLNNYYFFYDLNINNILIKQS